MRLCLGVYGAFMEPRPSFDFEDGADSISISGHKFIGSPFPTGVLITKNPIETKCQRVFHILDHSTPPLPAPEMVIAL